jgi:predicted nucleotidyltransferase
MKEAERRRRFTEDRSTTLIAKLKDAKKLVGTVACVYATGSFGRLEASEYSDLDLFIVGRPAVGDDGKPTLRSQLSTLDEICIKADLIEAIRKLKLPDFDGDGRYLIHRSVSEFVSALGTPEDDVNNTFTARLLMLLESRPILGHGVYTDAIDEIVAAYWRDFSDHKTSFVPAYLANDILRLWRTFCVNYEARTRRTPEDQKAKGKLKNYKLRHSRLLTCFSTILLLLAIYGRAKTVRPNDMVEMTKLTPIERLEALSRQRSVASARTVIRKLIDQYDVFLEKTNEPEAMMVLKFADREKRKELAGDAAQFGDLMFEAISTVGNGSQLHRMLLV